MHTTRHQRHLLSCVSTIIFSYLFLCAHTVYAAGTLSLQSLSPGVTVAAGTTVTLTANASGFTDPTFLIDDNFGGSTLTSSNINASGNVSWTPTLNDVGTHSFVVSAGDSLGNSASAGQTITVLMPTLTLSAPSPGAVVNAGVTVTWTSSIPGFVNPSYTVTDSFAGTITSTNINAGGYFNWAPQSTDVGNHTITVTARDAYGHSASASQAIVVNPPPSISISSFPTGTSFTPDQQVSFKVNTTGISSPTFSIRDARTPTTISNANFDAAGNFTWTPNPDMIGRHVLNIVVTDGATGSSLALTFEVNIQSLAVNLDGATQSTVYPGTPLRFSVSSVGFATTTTTLSDSFPGTSVSSANLNYANNFYWVPTQSDVGLHTLKFTVTDPLGHSASTTRDILVAGPTITLSNLFPLSTSTTLTTVTAGFAVSFTLGTTGFTSPVFTLVDNMAGTSQTGKELSTAGNFYWITKPSDVGTHILKISAKDALGHVATTNLTIVVTGTSAPTINTVTAPATTKEAGTGYIFTKALAQGSAGTEVTALQNALLRLGFFTGTPNGTFGPLTAAAVKKFQVANGLEGVGSVGPGTRALLNKGAAQTPSQTTGVTTGKYTFTKDIALGATGIAVTELQKLLTKLGFYAGPINGTFGPMTKAAVIKYQTKKGISALGGVGPGTRAALNAE